MNRDRCPICGRDAESGKPPGMDVFQISCPRCGPFVISETAAAMLPSRLAEDPLAAARASHIVRMSTSEDNWFEIDSTMVDDLTSQSLPSPTHQLTNVINWLKRQAGETPFAAQNVSDHDALAAIAGAVDGDAFDRVLQLASANGMVELSDNGTTAILTGQAWQEETREVAKEPMAPTANQGIAIIRGTCPQCGPGRHADVVASHEEHVHHDQEGLVWSHNTLNILKCRGCETVYVQRQHLFSEDEDYDYDPETGHTVTTIEPRITYWPIPARRVRPDWLDRLPDQILRDLLDEVYAALDADLRVLAAIGTRTAIDRAMVLKGADEASGFSAKLARLRSDGVIGEEEEQVLLTLTDAGSSAAHRGWRPDTRMLAAIMDGMENFLYRTLVLGETVTAMKGHVPRRRPSRVSRNSEHDPD